MAAQSQSLPPHAQLIQMALAYWGSQCVLVAAQLNLADRLRGGAMSAGDLARELGLHSPSLYRYLRTLAGMGIVTESSAQTFALTPLGTALKSDAPGSARASILTLTGPPVSDAWNHLRDSLETGKTGIEKVCGKQLFEYLGEHPAKASLFSETMIGYHGAEPPAIAAAYDFDQFRSIVDLGGATGNLLVHILRRHARPRGVLFDLPHVMADARVFLEQHGFDKRVSVESGNFFESVPSGHDAYLLSHVIHDWDDGRSHGILQNCRRAMGSKARLFIIEAVIPAGDVPHPAKMLDMMMLVGPGGQERTETEYATLLQRAGLRLTRVVPTNSGVGIIEAAPV